MVSRKLKAPFTVKLCYHIFHSISIVLLSTIYVSFLMMSGKIRAAFSVRSCFSFHKYCVVEYL